MAPTEYYTLIAELSDPAERQRAARALARALGAVDLLIFTRDPDVDALLPAPGFPQTLPAGRAWQVFLQACIAGSNHQTILPFPTLENNIAVLGVAGRDQSVLVLLGGAPDREAAGAMCVLLPLLAAAFRGERFMLAARASAAIAQRSVAAASALAASLDAARRELQQVVHEVRQLNEELERRVGERTEALRVANEELRRLAAHLQTAREDERLLIARELHDTLGQELTVMKMDLKRALHAVEALESPAAQRTSLLQKIRGLIDLTDSTIGSMRNLVTLLRPEILIEFGLKAAFESYLREFERRTGLAIRFSMDPGLDRLDRERAIALYRILQESLTNIVRHAHATRVEIRLVRDGQQLTLSVQDNGRGLGDDSVNSTGSFGVLGMRERAAMLNGVFSIQSLPAQGTVVSVSLPL